MTSLSPRELCYLEEHLLHRPDSSTLVDKNILKDSQLAPTLIKASEQLKWEKKTCFLQHKIHDRPEASDLIDRGILKQQAQVEIHRQEVSSNLEYLLTHRPLASDLKQKHIIPLCSAAPAIQAVQYKLEKDSQKMMLSSRLLQRPSIEEMQRKMMLFQPIQNMDICSSSSLGSSTSAGSGGSGGSGGIGIYEYESDDSDIDDYSVNYDDDGSEYDADDDDYHYDHQYSYPQISISTSNGTTSTYNGQS